MDIYIYVYIFIHTHIHACICKYLPSCFTAALALAPAAAAVEAGPPPPTLKHTPTVNVAPRSMGSLREGVLRGVNNPIIPNSP